MFVEPWKVAQKTLRWNVLFFFDAHAVLFCFSPFEWLPLWKVRLNRHALKSMLALLIFDYLRPPCCKLNRVTWSQSRNYVSKSPESQTRILNITAGFLFECLAELSENVVFFVTLWFQKRVCGCHVGPIFRMRNPASLNLLWSADKAKDEIWISGLYCNIWFVAQMFVCKIWGIRKQSIIHQTGDRNKICYHK